MSWIDPVVAVLILWSVVAGARRGLLRIGIGFCATLLGFILAAWFYGIAGGWLQPYVGSRLVANLLGFGAIFAAVLTMGAILSWVLSKAVKLVKLSWADRLLGAAFGFVRGVLYAVVLIFTVVTFSPKGAAKPIMQSKLAPYVLDASRWISAMTPNELKAGFRQGYEEIKKFWAEAHAKQKKPKEKS